MATHTDQTILKLVLAGMLALAIAMGIGRFAFTPLLPMMQSDVGLSLVQGGWIASANYMGYFVGALTAGRYGLTPLLLLRIGLVLVVLTTVLMGFNLGFAAWSTVRFIAGFSSAWVLVGTAVLGLGRLGEMGQGRLSGVVFGGVGVGIILAGLVCHGIVLGQGRAAWGWWVLSLFAVAGTLLVWRWLPGGVSGGNALLNAASVTERQSEVSRTGGASVQQLRLVVSYGLFGMGYILPATFLPVQARALMTSPALFGWVWPVFGLAALLSTLLVSAYGAFYTRRMLWIRSQWVMLVGIVLPVIWTHWLALMLAALCVGGTFMVVTMVGMQEARAIAGERAQRLIAAMTSAFAFGQLAGPLMMSSLILLGFPMNTTLIAAAAGLLVSNILLFYPARPAVFFQEKNR